MPVQVDPPIQLDPSMDTGHQLAFINQNFQSIANALSKNSFVIVGEGNTTIPSATLTASGTGYQATGNNAPTITHSLGYAPIILPFLDIDNGSEFAAFPSQGFSLNSGTSGGFVIYWYTATSDISQIFFNLNVIGFNANLTVPSAAVKYYLLQQTAK